MLPNAQNVDIGHLGTVLDGLLDLLRRAHAEPVSRATAGTLRRLAAHGPQRLSALAAAEGVTQPGMTQLVSRLERAGLAERVPDPADGRAVRVHLTPAGRAAVRRRRAERAAALRALLTTLPPADHDALSAALPALDRLARASAGPG
ncbi:hypothetical protein GCM10010123_29070 [Pilimelia anulata]|uniref:HTH marR-type domain-containing protein n=1 Tax=Pilimelia anulata TaxID=53371 RepID=A0A8J3B8N7_9ACTN|nr:MarR family transcriptional regulator [Pilimelia anulata]GGJ97252.1 hypothetical protein GCM10010123_29070 [Pilimelia anulata]